MKLILDTNSSPQPELELPADFYPELSRTNPFLTNEGSQSVPFTIPASRGNLRKLGFPERIRPTQRPETKRPAILSHGSVWMHGTLYIESVSMEEGITCTFYTNEGRLYEQIKGYKLQDINWDLISSEGVTVTALMHIFELNIRSNTLNDMYDFCCCSTKEVFNTKANSDADYFLVLNELKYVGDIAQFIGRDERKYYDGNTTSANEITVPAGYGVTPFIKVGYVLKKIFRFFGYEMAQSLFDTDISFKSLAILNNVADACVNGGGINPGDLLPEIDVEEFISAIRKKFGVEFYKDVDDKIYMKRWEDILFLSPDYEIRPVTDMVFHYEDAKGISMALSFLSDEYYSGGTTAKRVPPAGIEEEEITFSDQTPEVIMIVSAYTKDFSEGGLCPLYSFGPQIPSISHINTELIMDDEDETESESQDKLALSFVFIPHILGETNCSVSGTQYRYPFVEGTIDEWDYKYNQWGSFNLLVSTTTSFDSDTPDRSIYGAFYKSRDKMLQTANQQIVCQARIPLHEIITMDITRPKILDGQKVIIERIDYVLGQEELCQVTARTLHQMK